MKTLSSTRVVIPISLLVLVAVTLSLEYFSTLNLNRDQIITNRTLSLQNTLTYLQSSTELFLSSKSTASIQQTISSFSAERDISTLIITDNAGEVIASTDYDNVGKHWSQVSHPPTASIVNEIAGKHQSLVQISKDNNDLLGAIQVCNISPSGLNRLSSCGLLYIAVDLNYLTADSSKSSRNGIIVSALGTSLAALAILIILTVTVTGPAQKIVQGVNLFKNGDRKSRINISGNNELAYMGESINELFNIIETDEKEILEEKTRYSSLIDTMADGLIMLNTEGIIQSSNPSAEKLLGFASGELVGAHIKQLSPFLHPEKTKQYAQHFTCQPGDSDANTGREVQVRCKDGSVMAIRLSVSEIDVGGVKSTIGVFSDISELKAMAEELKKLNEHLLRSNKSLEKTATTDSLTGLYNRRQFDMTLLNEIQRATRQNNPLSLLIIDIDYFKQYNDHYGHSAGDECLMKVGECLRNQFKRNGDLAARYGGEEFAVILTGCSEADLEGQAEALRQAIENLQIDHEKSKVANNLTVSVGALAYLPLQHQIIPPPPKALFTEADRALYEAKARGRNQVVVVPYTSNSAALSNAINTSNWISQPNSGH